MTEQMVRRAVLIDARDDVWTVLEAVAAGETVVCGAARMTAREDIPQYHKIALRDIRRGEAVRKYGEIMGYATADIAAGTWIHEHNAASRPEEGDACREIKR